MLELQ